MLKSKLQRGLEEHKSEIILGGVAILMVGTGFILGKRYQKILTTKYLKDSITLTKAIEPMFPDTMPIAEIKEALSHIEGAEFFDALVANVNGVQSLFVR